MDMTAFAWMTHHVDLALADGVGLDRVGKLELRPTT
jgi:hypothetical protein